MNSSWPRVPLGEVLRLRKEFIRIDDAAQYKRCRVQLHAKGIVLRDCVAGLTVKTKEQQVCRAGEFLVAEIDAKVGGYGAVPDELDGAIVSSHYFLFTTDDTKLDRRFLDHYSKTPAFREQVKAQGSTNYAAIRPSHVLSYTIPLPPLSEQRRIVARIEELAGKIEEANGLGRQNAAASAALEVSQRQQLFEGIARSEVVSLGDAAELERGRFSHRPRNEPRFFGGIHPWIQIGEIESSDKFIRSWSQTLNDDGLAMSRKFPRGTLLISIAATIGAVGILDFDCCVPDSIVALTPRPGLNAEYAYHFLLYARSHLEVVAPQSAQKNINLNILSVMRIPRPPLAEQRRIVAYLDQLRAKVEELNRLQSETHAELDALLPSILDKAFKGEL